MEALFGFLFAGIIVVCTWAWLRTSKVYKSDVTAAYNAYKATSDQGVAGLNELRDREVSRLLWSRIGTCVLYAPLGAIGGFFAWAIWRFI